MREYKTQMEAARKGIITPEMKKVAEKEFRTEEEIRNWVAEGQVAICCNRLHTCIEPNGVGSMLRTKINVNLGVSKDCKDYDIEMQKVMAAVDMGAEAIMDLSSHGNTQPFRKKLTSECPAMIGTVPVYDSVIHYQRDLSTLTAKDFIDVVRLHAQDGVDFVTLHCGITRKTIEQIKKVGRKMNIVSRGGSLVFAWMCMTGEENPFYEYYDEILDICREYDVTISLGDACRPGCLADSSDVCQIEELVRLGELTRRAWAKDVQVMVEGPGHMAMDGGKADYLVEGAEYHMKRGSLLVMGPGEVHRTKLLADGVYERFAVNFPISFFDDIDPERRLMRLYTDRALGQMNLYERPGYEELFEELCVEYEDDYDRKLAAYRLIMEILSGLNSEFDDANEVRNNGKGRKKSTLSEKILKYVNNHISDELSIPLLAEKFYVSQSQIGRIFKQSTGASPWEYITAKRLVAARKMLENGKSAGEVSEKCGFGEYSSFYRAYVKRYGESPRGKRS